LNTIGRALLSVYGDSVSSLIMTEMADQLFEPWRFVSSIKLWFREASTSASLGDQVAKAALRSYMESEMSDRGRTEMKDWKTVSISPTMRKRLAALGVGLPSILARLYPDHPWEHKYQTKSEADSGWTKARHTTALAWIKSLVKAHGKF